MEAIPKGLSPDQLNEMEEQRLERMSKDGIDETDVLGTARDNLNNWNNYFNENLTRGKDDMNFVLRDQWTAIERSEFNRLFKPAMTFNKLYDATKKIAGEQRKNKPDLLVRSLTGKATQEQIDLRADLVRTISYQSQNDLVYQTAFKSALMMGYGAFQIDIDYESPMSFNKVIKYLVVPDATRTAFDPTAVKPHKGDGNWCSRSYVFSKDEFNATYPYILNPVSYSDPRTLLDFQWETRDTIVVCDYYKKEWYPLIVYKLSNGQTVTEDEWEDMQKQFKIQREIAESSEVVGGIILNEIPKIVDKRQTQDYKVMHYRLIQNQIIDYTEWPSKQLPIIFVDGDSHFIEGRQYTRSFIHEARDAQKFINYVGSEVAAEVKNRRREQWIGTPDNILGYEQMWRNPELQNGILIAKPDPKTGMLPQKMNAWELSQTLLAQYQRGTMDIKEILGFHEELEGQESNAQSGVAIANRQIAGSMSAYVYFDNLNQAIEQGGRVVLDLLPAVYSDEDRHVIISKQNGKTQSLILNQHLPDGSVQNEMSAGEYDIEIDTGPSFAVQKNIALQFLQQTVQANPQVFSLIADLWAKNLDVQFMPQLVERLQTMVPPNILAKENGEPPPPPPPPTPEMQMMQQEMQLKQGQMQERAADLKLRQQRHQLDQIEMIMRAREMQQKAQSEQADRDIELHKGEQDYSVKLAGILADLHKSEQQNKAQSAQ